MGDRTQNMGFAAPPPPEYDHEPESRYSIARLLADEVMRACFGIAVACTIPKRRVIVVDKSLKGPLLDKVLRHEKGHLNGWTH
jgi:hypothetical protein